MVLKAVNFTCHRLIRRTMGFDFLNTDKSNKGEESQDEGTVSKKKQCAELTEVERNQILVETQAKATKSLINETVKAFRRNSLHEQTTTHSPKYKIKEIFIKKKKAESTKKA